MPTAHCRSMDTGPRVGPSRDRARVADLRRGWRRVADPRRPAPDRRPEGRRSAGGSVAALQRALGIPADGIYGPQTRGAVRRFQRAHGLVVDGIAGRRRSPPSA